MPSENNPSNEASEIVNGIDNSHPDRVIFRDGVNSTNEQQNQTNSQVPPDDEPIAPIRPPIHSKTKNWYSGFCNRWASLIGACIKILIMILVNWYYGVTCIAVMFLIWLYIGTANPAVKPGLASEFRFFIWLKHIIFKCFGKRVHEYEQVIVTPTCPGVDVRSDQMNEENNDFSSRHRYHQSAFVQGRYVDDL